MWDSVCTLRTKIRSDTNKKQVRGRGGKFIWQKTITRTRTRKGKKNTVVAPTHPSQFNTTILHDQDSNDCLHVPKLPYASLYSRLWYWLWTFLYGTKYPACKIDWHQERAWCNCSMYFSTRLGCTGGCRHSSHVRLKGKGNSQSVLYVFF